MSNNPNYIVYRSGGRFLEGSKKLTPPSVRQASPHRVEVDLSHNTLGPFFTPGVSDGDSDHISNRLMEKLLRLYAPSWFRAMVLTPSVWILTPEGVVHEGQVCLVLEGTKEFGIIGIEADLLLSQLGSRLPGD